MVSAQPVEMARDRVCGGLPQRAESRRRTWTGAQATTDASDAVELLGQRTRLGVLWITRGDLRSGCGYPETAGRLVHAEPNAGYPPLVSEARGGEW